MLTQQDLKQLTEKGISEEKFNLELEEIKQGFPFLKLKAAATIGNGILKPTDEERDQYISTWNTYKGQAAKVVKFVPASGAASRMFKDLFAFLNADYDTPQTDFEKTFFDNIDKFAFHKALCDKCKENENKCIKTLLEEGNYKAVVANLLEEKGLNYGQLPKGLLLFHTYENDSRTPMEEHLVEAALYASTQGEANVHFTVSHDHLELFKQKVAEKANQYSERFGVKYNISFSEQKPSTDTIAANLDNTPFRQEDGSLLFRPGGHGALIENLNELNADVVFVKNIDNVVPDRLKEETVTYKALLAGVLVSVQQQCFEYLHLLEADKVDDAKLHEMLSYLENTLCSVNPETAKMDTAALKTYLYHKFNRPIRVCGMVKNVGEPGGGPFLAFNQDGSASPQILESSQIDKSNAEYQRMFTEGTHFNPVDLVCAIKDYKGEPFHLPDFVDKNTGFISSKSKNGKNLKALELPGLWNGAMSDWNTVFVEVPLGTFNPVKTVNDLLREQHQ